MKRAIEDHHESLSICAAIILTVAIILSHPWSALWYPPIAVVIGAVIGFIVNTILCLVGSIIGAEVNS